MGQKKAVTGYRYIIPLYCIGITSDVVSVKVIDSHGFRVRFPAGYYYYYFFFFAVFHLLYLAPNV